MIWLVAATVNPSSRRNPAESARTGTPHSARHVTIDRREEQRPPDDREQRERGHRDDDERIDLRVADPEEGAEEQRVDSVQQAVVETDEQEPEPERECLHGARRSGLAAVAAGPVRGDTGEHERAGPAGAEVAERERNTGKRGARRSRKGDQRERVPGKGLATQHHEPADRAGHHGDRGAGLESVRHEVEREERADVRQGIPGEPLEEGALSGHGRGGVRARTGPRAGRRRRAARRSHAAPRRARRRAGSASRS